MSAVQAIRNRLGFGLGISKAAADTAVLSSVGSSIMSRVISGRQGSAVTRTQSLLSRHLGTVDQSGAILELGQRDVSHREWLPETVRLDQRDVAAADGAGDLLESLRSIRTASYDAVFSIDVVEQFRMPWRIADEISRILRPGGVTFHSTVFTTRYRPEPGDFFRFTPDGLKSLFGDLECLTAEFDATEQPRDSRKVKRCPSEIFGGSREGWRVHYAGRKAALR